MPRPDRDETNFEYGCGLSLGLISPTTSSRPGHTRVSPRCTHMKGIQRLSATHPSRRSFGTARRIRILSGSHLGSTLSSGGAVLTRGVSRRSGSVAYIHADASPTEVLASSILTPAALSVKHYREKDFASAQAAGQIRPRRPERARAPPAVGGPSSCGRRA